MFVSHSKKITARLQCHDRSHAHSEIIPNSFHEGGLRVYEHNLQEFVRGVQSNRG